MIAVTAGVFTVTGLEPARSLQRAVGGGPDQRLRKEADVGPAEGPDPGW